MGLKEDQNTAPTMAELVQHHQVLAGQLKEAIGNFLKYAMKSPKSIGRNETKMMLDKSMELLKSLNKTGMIDDKVE